MEVDGQVLEILQQLSAELSADRFRVKLYAPEWFGTVAKTHEEMLVGPGNRLQLIRQLRNNQRVITHGGEILWNIPEESATRVLDLAQTSVHRFRRMYDPAPEDMSDALMSEADSEQGNVQGSQQLPANAKVLRI